MKFWKRFNLSEDGIFSASGTNDACTSAVYGVLYEKLERLFIVTISILLKVEVNFAESNDFGNFTSWIAQSSRSLPSRVLFLISKL